jgi:hypothetical protein
MAHKEEGRRRLFFGDIPVKNTHIGDDPEKAAGITGMAKQSPPAGIIYGKVGGFAMTPLIGGPQFQTPAG